MSCLCPYCSAFQGCPVLPYFFVACNGMCGERLTRSPLSAAAGARAYATQWTIIISSWGSTLVLTPSLSFYVLSNWHRCPCVSLTQVIPAMLQGSPAYVPKNAARCPYSSAGSGPPPHRLSHINLEFPLIDTVEKYLWIRDRLYTAAILGLTAMKTDRLSQSQSAGLCPRLASGTSGNGRSSRSRRRCRRASCTAQSPRDDPLLLRVARGEGRPRYHFPLTLREGSILVLRDSCPTQMRRGHLCGSCGRQGDTCQSSGSACSPPCLGSHLVCSVNSDQCLPAHPAPVSSCLPSMTAPVADFQPLFSHLHSAKLESRCIALWPQHSDRSCDCGLRPCMHAQQLQG
jgi:hypothetical protein